MEKRESRERVRALSRCDNEGELLLGVADIIRLNTLDQLVTLAENGLTDGQTYGRARAPARKRVCHWQILARHVRDYPRCDSLTCAGRCGGVV